ncbi:PucR family transcriptional regulator [Lentzea atacamensis]|uniref:PucR family transcriptional regulator n=1 Tax=Lentzea atacamensis TaxID=531938 RepID=UPI001476293A|nr:helix-turn-helix domain-containing protein [Lentzea atacamensis]
MNARCSDRSRLLSQILADDDGDGDAHEAERVLGLRQSDYHWAVVLRSAPGCGLAAEDLVRVAQTINRETGGARPLVVVNRGREVWTWTQGTRPPEPEALAAVRTRLSAVDGLQVGAGPVAQGTAGFRRSLLGAQAALHSASTHTGWYAYEDVSVVSLLAKDDDRTRWFVADVLGELASTGPWHAILRETLRLYLAMRRSRQQVAAAMYINRNTVAYRVEKATRLLGRAIDEDAFEVRLALEIVRARGQDRPSAPSPADDIPFSGSPGAA